MASPYDLPWGSEVYAKVSAINIVGSSEYSLEGNGGIILTVPDAPIELSSDPLINSATQIGILWTEGTENGGATVLDYSISYAPVADSTYTTISSVTDLVYTITSLSAGTQYKIKVQARNIYGLSLDSEEITVLAGQIPDAPA
jgi:hypothetical protein